MHRVHRQLPRPTPSSPIPKLKLKSFKDYIDEGKSFDEALKPRLPRMAGQDPGRRAGAQRPSVRGISQQDVGRRLQAAGARRRQVAGAGEGRPRGLRQSGRRADRLYLKAGGLDRSRRHRRPHQARPGRRRFADRAADRHRRRRRQRGLRQRPPEHRAALPVGRLAHHRRNQEGPVALRPAGAVPELVAGTSLDGKGVARRSRLAASVHDLRRQQAYYEDKQETTVTTPMSGPRSSRTSRSTRSSPRAR